MTEPTKILVIEDNRDFAQLLCDIFEIKGCRVRVAHTAASGLAAAEDERPDLIFCDIRLPGDMSGLELARVLRAHPQLGDVPVVGVTGYVNQLDQQAALDAGFHMVFPKPVKFADLSRALETYGPPSAKAACGV